MEDEHKLRKKVARGAWVIARDKAALALALTKVSAYEEAFARLQNSTKIHDLDQLVHTFTQAEDHNFQLFNQLNNLCASIDGQEHKNEELRLQIRQCEQQQQYQYGTNATPAASLAGNTNTSDRRALLSSLEASVARVRDASAQYEQKQAAANATLSSLRISVQQISRKLYNHSEEERRKRQDRMVSASKLRQQSQKNENNFEETKENELEEDPSGNRNLSKTGYIDYDNELLDADADDLLAAMNLGGEQALNSDTIPVTDSSLLQHLAAIERRVTRLLRHYQLARLQNDTGTDQETEARKSRDLDVDQDDEDLSGDSEIKDSARYASSGINHFADEFPNDSSNTENDGSEVDNSSDSSNPENEKEVVPNCDENAEGGSIKAHLSDDEQDGDDEEVQPLSQEELRASIQ